MLALGKIWPSILLAYDDFKHLKPILEYRLREKIVYAYFHASRQVMEVSPTQNPTASSLVLCDRRARLFQGVIQRCVVINRV